MPGKVANGELLAGCDSSSFFIMRGCGLCWVLTVLGQGGGRGSEVGRNKIKKQKVSLPLLHVQGKKKKNNSGYNNNVLCFSPCLCGDQKMNNNRCPPLQYLRIKD